MAKYIGGAFGFIHGNPDGFGVYYVGSTEQKKNARKHKKFNKINNK